MITFLNRKHHAVDPNKSITSFPQHLIPNQADSQFTAPTLLCLFHMTPMASFPTIPIASKARNFHDESETRHALDALNDKIIPECDIGLVVPITEMIK